ncbi:hypothetical protein COLO4_35916 [Corchorus olitorius]|uniref:Uncharacterized protein n=1 Tax=Corchorus olitorius TaxID=93759 RepID=A0A1R3GBY0_9ROSI|nr:hypothetical protein COLO4_35916 [Corchorus olitorius]
MVGASLSQMCSNLSLQEKEKDKVIIENAWIEDPEEAEVWHYLIDWGSQFWSDGIKISWSRKGFSWRAKLIVSGIWKTGCFGNHADSLLLHRRPVARALLPPGSQPEVDSKEVVGVVAQKSGDEVISKRTGKLPMIEGGMADFVGTGKLGEKENVRMSNLREPFLTEGGGENLEEFRAQLEGSSGPNSLEQLYSNIPGVGLPVMGHGSTYNPNFGLHKGKKVKSGLDNNEAMSYSGPAEEYYKMMNEAVDGSPFVVGAGEEVSSRECHLKEGRKRSRVGNEAVAKREFGGDYVSLGVDQTKATDAAVKEDNVAAQARHKND